MQNVLLTIQIALSVLLVVLIIIQPKGSGLGRSFGASEVSFSRRGLDKFIYKLTFIVALLFLVISTVAILV